MRRLPGLALTGADGTMATSLVVLQDGQRNRLGEMRDREEGAIPCFQCGVCCIKWQPLLSPTELRRVAGDLGLTPRTFKRRYTRPYPLRRGWHQFKTGAVGCIFLAFDRGRALCTIHTVRPQVCRDWSPGLTKKECLEGLRTLEGPPLLTPQDLYPTPEDRQGLIAALEPLTSDEPREGGGH